MLRATQWRAHRRWAATLGLALQVWCVPAGVADDADEGERLLGVVGSEEFVWIYHHRLDPTSGERLLTFGVRSKSLETFSVPPTLKSLRGRVHSTAIVGRSLHVIFDEGTHRSYRLRERPSLVARVRASTERPLPGHVTPLALGGDEHTGSVYAIVLRETALGILRDEVSRAEEELEESAAAVEEESAGEQALSEMSDIDEALDAGRFFVVRYRLGRWTVVSALPSWFDAARECRLAVDTAERAHVLFVGRGQRSYQHAWFADDAWSVPAVVTDDASFRIAGLSGYQEGLVAVGTAQSGDGVSLYAILFADSRWLPQAACTLSDPTLLGHDDRLAASLFGDSIAVALVDDEQRVRFGRWPMAGQEAIEPFAPVDILQAGESASLSWRAQSMAAFIVLGVLLAAAFWRRSDSITQEAELPAEYTIASYWRRLFGFALDAMPVALISMKFWAEPLSLWLDEYHELQREGGPVPPLSNDLLYGWVVACAGYTLYCITCEALYAATPGKLVLQCRVVDENGQRCRIGQVLIRNALRLVELFPLFQLWPTFILMLFTRKRQRLGDLLARTVVVERARSSQVTAPPSDGEEKKPGQQ